MGRGEAGLGGTVVFAWRGGCGFWIIPWGRGSIVQVQVTDWLRPAFWPDAQFASEGLVLPNQP